MSLRCKSPLVKDKASNKCVSKPEAKLRKRRSAILKKMNKLENKLDVLDDKLEESNQNWLHYSDDDHDKKSLSYKKSYSKYKKSVKNIKKKIQTNTKTHDSLLDQVILIEKELGIPTSEPY